MKELRCNHVRLGHAHRGHRWEAQPGMEPVHCPGLARPTQKGDQHVRDDVVGTLAEWIPGYSTPENGPQSRIRVVGTNDESLTVSYETPVNSGNLTLYRVWIEVEKLDECRSSRED